MSLGGSCGLDFDTITVLLLLLLLSRLSTIRLSYATVQLTGKESRLLRLLFVCEISLSPTQACDPIAAATTEFVKRKMTLCFAYYPRFGSCKPKATTMLQLARHPQCCPWLCFATDGRRKISKKDRLLISTSFPGWIERLFSIENRLRKEATDRRKDTINRTYTDVPCSNPARQRRFQVPNYFFFNRTSTQRVLYSTTRRLLQCDDGVWCGGNKRELLKLDRLFEVISYRTKVVFKIARIERRKDRIHQKIFPTLTLSSSSRIRKIDSKVLIVCEEETVPQR